jgi:GNAT superfamily N-acetyltransferase
MLKTTIREATPKDILRLVIHHRKMFQEILKNRGEDLALSVSKAIEKSYREKLKKELLIGTCKVWIIEDGDKIIASGAITIIRLVPTPIDLSSNAVWLHSMYTEKKYRGHQCAQRIIKKALQCCKKNGLKRIMLNASPAGRPVYEKLGFQPSPDTMRLIIK